MTGYTALFEPAATLVVRAPLLPVQRYLGLAAAGGKKADPLVRMAVHVASPALGAAIDRATEDTLPPRVRSSLLRYLIRMSTRPTPFGLFAGVAVTRWADRTTMRIVDGSRPTRTRPDMGWLTGWLLALEADADVRAQARLVTNTCAFEHAGRVHLTDRSTGGIAGRPDVSIRATAAVRRALALAREPIGHEVLAAALLTGRGATPERVHGLIEELCRLDLLLTDLRPPMTADPVGHARDRLLAMPATREAGERLAGAVAAAGRLDRDVGAAGFPTAIAELRARLRDLREPDLPDTDVLQVDSALPLAGTLSRKVADDAARAADLLLRLHPRPTGPPHLAAYRAQFLARYGADRRVPLLELLDPRFGLGPPAAGPPARTLTVDGHDRDRALLELAAEALRDGTDEITLDARDVDALSTWVPDPAALPPSLELSLFVLARDTSAIDRGDYRVVVGPNLGAQAAGRGLGRFADLLGDEAAGLLTDLAVAHRDRLPDGICAELVYLPSAHRSANVTIRPVTHPYEIPVGLSAGVLPDHVVAPDRLTVGVRDGRLRLWWDDVGCEVSVSAGHMLNTVAAPQVCRFLTDVGQDGVAGLSEFDWGTAGTLPFLPRVRAGRVILAPAQWRARRTQLRTALRADDVQGFDVALKGWRERWRVPRYVYLAAGDNRLLLDLDDAEQSGLLCTDLRRASGADLVLHEALPAIDHAWLPGPCGRYVSEVVVPLVRRDPGTRLAPEPAVRGAEPQPEPGERLRPPGSDWLYLKLYGPGTGEDALLRGPAREILAGMVDDGDVDGWFFVRYADPAAHLRLRIHGEPDVLSTRALPRLMTWAAGLIAAGERTHVTLDSYEREVERYGGIAGMPLAERIFAADSAATVDLVGLLAASGAPDRLELAVVSIDALLVALGMDAAARLAWCCAQAPPPSESGAAYRERKRRLRDLLSVPGAVDGWPAGTRAVLQARMDAVGPTAARLAQLHAHGVTSRPLDVLATSFVHLHANRLGLSRSDERLAIGLLRRTLAGLAASPPPAPAPAAEGRHSRP